MPFVFVILCLVYSLFREWQVKGERQQWADERRELLDRIQAPGSTFPEHKPVYMDDEAEAELEREYRAMAEAEGMIPE